MYFVSEIRNKRAQNGGERSEAWPVIIWKSKKNALILGKNNLIMSIYGLKCLIWNAILKASRRNGKFLVARMRSNLTAVFWKIAVFGNFAKIPLPPTCILQFYWSGLWHKYLSTWESLRLRCVIEFWYRLLGMQMIFECCWLLEVLLLQ